MPAQSAKKQPNDTSRRRKDQQPPKEPRPHPRDVQEDPAPNPDGPSEKKPPETIDEP